jgi:hypothetical protein
LSFIAKSFGKDIMGKPVPTRSNKKRPPPENPAGPGRKPIFTPGTVLVRLQLAIPYAQMEKLRLLAAFRNVHPSVVLAEIIEEGWEAHHRHWMNQDLMTQPPASDLDLDQARE